MALHDNLKKLRTERGLIKRNVADGVGITERTYISYEYGRTEPNMETLSKLADFYEVTTDYLLGREPAPEPVVDYASTQEEANAVIEEIANLNPEMQAVMLDFLHKLSDAARARRAGSGIQQNSHTHEATKKQSNEDEYIDTTIGEFQDAQTDDETAIQDAG